MKDIKHKLSIFIFRRDLRLYDNTGLIRALNESTEVIPLFILTPNQISNNKYKSSNAIQFMIESLYDLNHQIKSVNSKKNLWITFGEEILVIKRICSQYKISAIYVNEDYTPYSIERDKRISDFCKNEGMEFVSETDILLIDNEPVYANNGNTYRVFNLFYNKAKKIPVRIPIKNKNNNFLSADGIYKKMDIHKMDKYLLDNKYYTINNNLAINGGRINAIEILKHVKLDYNKIRDFPAFTTSMTSAHNKFGTVSIREVYYAFVKEKTGNLCKQLYWRDYYYYISINFDKFYAYDHLFKPANHKFLWENNKKHLLLWQSGKTGFPFVDASMRELNVTGYIHNRSRLVVSEFLIKTLLIDWKYGERYFSKTLVDIDRAQNMGNWNWAASFGLDSSPFLRIFNVWSQSKKYDPECKYIKIWLPELYDIIPAHIHRWDKYCHEYPDVEYLKPIVNYESQRKIFIERFKKYF